MSRSKKNGTLFWENGKANEGKVVVPGIVGESERIAIFFNKIVRFEA